MMNIESPNTNKTSPKTEKPTEKNGNETALPDAGSIQAETANGRDWNRLEDRYEMIAEAAYYKAEQRGFAVGDEELDWLEAEQELLENMTE